MTTKLYIFNPPSQFSRLGIQVSLAIYVCLSGIWLGGLFYLSFLSYFFKLVCYVHIKRIYMQVFSPHNSNLNFTPPPPPPPPPHTHTHIHTHTPDRINNLPSYKNTKVSVFMHKIRAHISMYMQCILSPLPPLPAV